MGDELRGNASCDHDALHVVAQHDNRELRYISVVGWSVLHGIACFPENGARRMFGRLHTLVTPRVLCELGSPTQVRLKY